MAIAFRDFFPLARRGVVSNEYESFEAVVTGAKDWIAQSGVSVFNVETVVLPNVGNEAEARHTNLRPSGEMSSYWRQMLRVWHGAPPTGPDVPPPSS
jgi:hypothetical protein